MDVFEARDINLYAELCEEAYTRHFIYPRITEKEHFQLYQHPFREAYILVIRGTSLHDAFDIEADLALAINNTNTARFNEIRQWVKMLRSAYPNKELILIGHSLGGSIASVVGKEFGLESVSFNAGQPLLQSVPVNDKQIHFYNSEDIISNRNRTESEWNTKVVKATTNYHSVQNSNPIVAMTK
jgi:hypothetical protein